MLKLYSKLLLALLVAVGSAAPTALRPDSLKPSSNPTVEAGVPPLDLQAQIPFQLHEISDPESSFDQGLIQRWAAIGDSYAAGIGAGTMLGGSSDKECSRYNESYPYLMSKDARMSNNPQQNFQFLACSGATSLEILQMQIPNISESQAVTLSAGGNDIGLSDVLVACVFQYAPINLPAGQCDEVLKTTQQKIQDVLPGNLDKLLQALKSKLASDGTIYYTAYARFFEASTPQCDNVTWAFRTALLNRPYLTTNKRKKMNDLVDATNQAIQKAVVRAGDQVVYVSYDNTFSDVGGLFCEADVMEPQPNRPLLLFYEYDTDDNVTVGIPQLNPGDLKERRTKHAVEDNRASGINSGSISANIMTELLASKSNENMQPAVKASLYHILTSTLLRAIASPNRVPQRVSSNNTIAQTNFFKNTPTNANGGKNVIADWFLTDIQKRVFHPRPLGHLIIANLVLYKMAERRARALKTQIAPGIFTFGKSSPLRLASPAAPEDKYKDYLKNGLCTCRGHNWQSSLGTAGDFRGCRCSGASVEAFRGLEEIRGSVQQSLSRAVPARNEYVEDS